MAKEKAVLMDGIGLQRALMRIAHEIVEHNRGTEDLCIVGIRSRGEPLAKLIRDNILKIENAEVPCGDLDIYFYRDDLTHLADSPVVRRADLPFSVVGKKVVLVDDVLYTGRTARAAIEAVFSLGRPAEIQFAVLIDRGHRELPIRADYVGKSIPTSRREMVAVHIPPFESDTGALLLETEGE
jgi:pyrimidine operon attenuation protein/uracil phosphoribosyltransferase